MYRIKSFFGGILAHLITYTYKKQDKKIPFSYRQFHHIYEAAAAEEGIDLTQYLIMEKQVEDVSKGTKSVREFRKNHFTKLGFTNMWFIKDGIEE